MDSRFPPCTHNRKRTPTLFCRLSNRARATSKRLLSCRRDRSPKQRRQSPGIAGLSAGTTEPNVLSSVYGKAGVVIVMARASKEHPLSRKSLAGEFRCTGDPDALEGHERPTSRCLIHFASSDGFTRNTRRWGPRDTMTLGISPLAIIRWILLRRSWRISPTSLGPSSFSMFSIMLLGNRSDFFQAVNGPLSRVSFGSPRLRRAEAV